MVIALEKIPDVLVMAAEQAQKSGQDNLRFIWGDAVHLDENFAEGEIDRLYINFCDPWPHWKQASKRLVHRGFLDIYRPLLSLGGHLHFKTDNAPLFTFAKKELYAAGWNMAYAITDLPSGGDNIETEYESRFRAQGIPIASVKAAPSKAEA